MKLMSNNPPHIRSKDTVATIMQDAIIAMIPLYFMAYYFYGMRAVLLGLTGVATCCIADVLCVKLAGRKIGLADISPVITGMLIPLFMPATISYNIVIIASIFAICVVKQPFGGSGQNIFNPAAGGLAFAIICFPQKMFSYSMPLDKLALGNLIEFKAANSPAYTMFLGGAPKIDAVEMFLGNFPGPMGATNILVLTTCLLFLIVRKTASIKMTASFLLSVSILSLIFPRANMNGFESVQFELMSGTLLISSIFLLNDPTTSPKRESSKVLYGVAVAIATVFYRYYGGFEESTIFAILFMNTLVWIIDINNEKLHSRLRRHRFEINKAKKLPR